MSKVEKPSKYVYQTEIAQMMFVFGEVCDPNESTTQIIEEITRAQIVELLAQAVNITQMRGSRSVAPEDLMFLMRHDKSKVNRMRSFLSWKDVRKNVKDDRGTTTADAEELIDESDKMIKMRKLKVKLPWDLIHSLSSVLAEDEDDDDINDEDREAYEDQIQRLKVADELTRSMTKDEYVYYSECRQSSFTFKKSKKFKDWCNMTQYVDSKVSSDVIDILGFLAYEIVCKLTEQGLQVKREWESKSTKPDAPVPLKESTSINDGLFEGEATLFVKDKDNIEQSPLQPKHIHEAFRRLQKTSLPLTNFLGHPVRTKLGFI